MGHIKENKKQEKGKGGDEEEVKETDIYINAYPTLSSVNPPAISGTNLLKRRRVSKSSTIFDALFVTNNRKRDSMG